MSLQIAVTRLGTAERLLISGLQINIAPGTVHTLMGPSGSGKSSLLAAVAGTLAPALQWQGNIALNGQRIGHLPPQARRVGILFQDDLLFAHMTVRENLLFATPRGPAVHRQAEVRQAQVQAALASVEMQGFDDADPATLSGGQRIRVALARALLAQPAALLLDEPFSKLDMALRGRIRALVQAQVAQRQIPALLVTHDPADISDPQALSTLDASHA